MFVSQTACNLPAKGTCTCFTLRLKSGQSENLCGCLCGKAYRLKTGMDAARFRLLHSRISWESLEATQSHYKCVQVSDCLQTCGFAEAYSAEHSDGKSCWTCFPCKRSPGDYPGFLHLHAKMSCKSPRKHAASYVYMAEVRASILVLVCRIISTLTATGFSNAKFRASCCALALLEWASTYVLLNKHAPSSCFSLLPWVLLRQCWEHKCQHVITEKKRHHPSAHAYWNIDVCITSVTNFSV